MEQSKNQVEELVYNSLQDEAVPENLAEAITWLQDTLDGIPAEHRASAKIEIDSESEYDSHFAVVQISYNRPETDAELAKRIALAERQENQAQQAELALFKRLKQKFGDGA